jgi:peptidyl-prolyl cis-trans isomerase SurA
MQKFKYLLFCATLTAGSVAMAKPQPIDSIAAVVNDSVITKSELAQQVSIFGKQMQQETKVHLDPKAVEKQVLEQLVMKEIQLNMAKKTGIQVDETGIDNAIENIAKQHHLTVTQLREAVSAEGVDFNQYRQTIRNQMVISQLQQRDILGGIQISEQEVNQFLQSPNGLGEMTTEYRISHILLPLSESPTPEEIDQVTAKAKQIVTQLQKGKDFAALAVAESTGEQALKGGDLGWRKLAELPTIFTKLVTGLKVNDIPEPIRSGSGIHIIKLMEKRNASQAQAMTEKTMVRHILIKTNSSTSDQDAQQRLNAMRHKIEKGEDFAQLAKSHSADLGSASNGGSIGWVSPEVLVPEFREQIKKLPLKEISAPFKTSFGWHIVQVMDRQKQSTDEAALRQKAREMLRQRKAEEKMQAWSRQLRDEAYVKTMYDS